MPNKNLTDNEIKKGLECCKNSNCLNCPFNISKEENQVLRVENCVATMKTLSLNLIHRLEAENERLKAEAYKELAENIKGEIENVINNIRRKKKQHKSNISKIPLFDDNDIFYAKHNGKEEVLEDIRKYIDNLLKEMIGE